MEKRKEKMEVAPLDYASHCYAKAASENGGGGGKTKRGGGFDKWSFWKEYSGREGGAVCYVKRENLLLAKTNGLSIALLRKKRSKKGFFLDIRGKD